MTAHLQHQSVKRYGHDVGLSAVFRQWRATSHCNQLHGYALAVKLVFKSSSLDTRNWVVDFGALKPIKEWLAATFDHAVLVAVDDPQFDEFMGLHHLGLIRLVKVQATGCEAFAEMIAEYVNDWLLTGYLPSLRQKGIPYPDDLHCAEVEVSEHGANSASWFY